MDEVIELALHTGKTRAAQASRAPAASRRVRAARKRA
jgi:hypothetical protein